jgi:hypothetical protein
VGSGLKLEEHESEAHVAALSRLGIFDRVRLCIDAPYGNHGVRHGRIVHKLARRISSLGCGRTILGDSGDRLDQVASRAAGETSGTLLPLWI